MENEVFVDRDARAAIGVIQQGNLPQAEVGLHYVHLCTAAAPLLRSTHY